MSKKKKSKTTDKITIDFSQARQVEGVFEPKGIIEQAMQNFTSNKTQNLQPQIVINMSEFNQDKSRHR